MEPLQFLFTIRRLQSSCELSTSPELSHLLSSDLNLSLSSGVDTLTSWALVYAERTETYKLNLVTCYESILDGCNCCVESLLCVYL